MKRPVTLVLATTILMAVVTIGCGGEGIGEPPTRGEGNIPIGKMPRPNSGELFLNTPGGEQRRVRADAQGLFETPPLPPGIVRARVVPDDRRYAPVDFEFRAGLGQRFVFTIRPPRIGKDVAQATMDVDLGDEPRILRLGQTYELFRQESLDIRTIQRPSIVVNGGVATLDDEDRLRIVSRGQGEVVLFYGRQSKTYRFTAQ